MGIMEEYFDGKTYVIAGIGPGQGLSTARLLKKFGANVYGISRSGVFPSEKVDKGIKIEKCNLEDVTEIRKTLEGIVKEGGVINGSVNNVGTWEPADNKVVKPDTLMKFFRLNVMTQYNLIYTLKDILGPGSSMVNIGASRHLFFIHTFQEVNQRRKFHSQCFPLVVSVCLYSTFCFSQILT